MHHWGGKLTLAVRELAGVLQIPQKIEPVEEKQGKGGCLLRGCDGTAGCPTARQRRVMGHPLKWKGRTLGGFMAPEVRAVGPRWGHSWPSK